LLYLLAKKTDLLRDRAPVLWRQSKPYSLSAFQAAWWFGLILTSFVLIWLITGQYDFSPTALILLSIGLGTSLGATVIDSNKRNEASNPQIDNNELSHLLRDKQRLETELNDLTKAKDNDKLEQKKSEYRTKIDEIKEKFPNAIGPGGTKFYLDILSDSNGISFHRFQMLIWTLALGIIFITSVLGRLAMPDFDATLLALMGISAGTYLGFKIPENNGVATEHTTIPPAQEPPKNGAITPPSDKPGEQK